MSSVRCSSISPTEMSSWSCYYVGLVILSLTLYTDCLSCFKCSQRLAALEVCINATKEDCSVVFPTQDSVCLKTVQKFASGQPPWVFAQCQIMQAFSAEQIDSCQVSKGDPVASPKGGNKSEDQFVTCTCTTDTCNAAQSLSTTFWAMAPLMTVLLRINF